jgi:trehalose 6-phosphate phosphatase
MPASTPIPAPAPTAPALPQPHSDWALFLDVDGTLVEIAETPDGVEPDARLPGILSALSRSLDGAVALISGRPIDMLDGLFAPVRLPAAGLHGLERRDADGHRHAAAPSPAIRAAAAAAEDFARANPGVLIEDKGATVALHFRQAPALGPAATRLAEELVAAHAGTTLQKGKMVVEIRPAGKDKGSVVAEFMAEAPFRGRTPVFIGDDVTDEAGFRMVNRLGGHSVRIGGQSGSEATYGIPSVTAFLDWLAHWSEGG